MSLPPVAVQPRRAPAAGARRPDRFFPVEETGSGRRVFVLTAWFGERACTVHDLRLVVRNHGRVETGTAALVALTPRPCASFVSSRHTHGRWRTARNTYYVSYVRGPVSAFGPTGTVTVGPVTVGPRAVRCSSMAPAAARDWLRAHTDSATPHDAGALYFRWLGTFVVDGVPALGPSTAHPDTLDALIGHCGQCRLCARPTPELFHAAECSLYTFSPRVIALEALSLAGC